MKTFWNKDQKNDGSELNKKEIKKADEQIDEQTEANEPALEVKHVRVRGKWTRVG